MMRKTSSIGQNHWERRARGLSHELDRMLWERMLKNLPVPTPAKIPAAASSPSGT
ncbi:hypothetical protein KJ612_14910 [Myxococcota bacterium]|jgi:hypothetical protein|nr:hypothetical protein [Myxococcota bacterium]MBU1412245.1 hypothetical protein [Myxococcota bacterium]